MLLSVVFIVCLCHSMYFFFFFFFFQAEDGIRDIGVTGVQTCALPICAFDGTLLANGAYILRLIATDSNGNAQVTLTTLSVIGENKPGRVTSTVTDLQVPLGGIPITIEIGRAHV